MQTKFNLLQVIDLLLRSRASITIANQKRYYCHGGVMATSNLVKNKMHAWTFQYLGVVGF